MPLVTITSNIAQQLKTHGVFPDVLPEFEQQGLITASYGPQQDVTMGNTLKVSETQTLPKVQLMFDEPEPEAKYTLVITDPDAPKRGDKKWSEYAHYIASGIVPKASQQGESFEVDFGNANELLPYMGPAPPDGTGKHRYVFLLFKQGQAKVNGLPVEATPENRACWGTGVPGSGVKDWATKHQLTPVAINFFFAQSGVQ